MALGTNPYKHVCTKKKPLCVYVWLYVCVKENNYWAVFSRISFKFSGNPPRGIGPSRGPQRQPGARENPGTSYADSPPRGAGTRDPRRLPGAGENPDGTSYTGNPSRGTGRVTRDPRRLTGTGGNPGTSYARNPQRGARATMVLRRPLGAGGRIARGGGRIDRGKTRKYYKGRETGYRGVRGGQGAEGWNKGTYFYW